MASLATIIHYVYNDQIEILVKTMVKSIEN